MPGRAIELFQQQSGVNHLALRLPPSVEAEALDLLIDRLGGRLSYAPKERIFHENDPAEYLYKVISGLVCASKLLSDGRRQIGEFYLPGDYLDLGVLAHILFQRKQSRTLKFA